MTLVDFNVIFTFLPTQECETAKASLPGNYEQGHFQVEAVGSTSEEMG